MKKFRFGVVALAATALVAAGCGGDDENNTTASGGGEPAMTETHSMETKTSGKGGTETKAAALRSTLTAGLQEHVYLAGIAVDMGVNKGLDSGEFKAAAATLDKNSVALSEAVGGIYGDAAAKTFLKQWRAHIVNFVQYTEGKATKNDALVKKAQAGLAKYVADHSAFFAKANPNLPAEAVATDLKGHIATLVEAVDAVLAKDPSAFNKLQAAAAHMPGTANVLAGGIAKQFPDKFPGNAASGASELRASLTAALQEHTYLAGIAVAQGVNHGLDSKQFEASAGTLDKNSVAISKVIGSLYGADAEKEFLKTWRDHITFFVDYTKGKATKDNAMVKKAVADLDAYRAEAGAFFEKANPNLTADAISNDLKGHIATLAAAVDAVVAGDGEAFDLLQSAAGHMPGTAQVLAGAIQKQFPKKFPA